MVKKTKEDKDSSSKLQQEMRRLAVVMHNSNEAIIIQDMDGKITTWNRGAEKMYGYSVEEALGMNIELITPAGKMAEQKEYFRRLLAGDAVDSFETCRVAKDGSILDVWLTVTKVLEEPSDSVISQDQKIVRPIGLALLERNITARKQAEASLHRRLASQGLLMQIANNFNNILIEDINATIDTTLRMIGEYDHNDRSFIGAFSDDQTSINNTHEWCASGISPGIDRIRGMTVSLLPWWIHKLQSLVYTYVPRVDDLPVEAQAEKEMLQAQAVQSLIVVPMFLEDKILGYLGVASVRSEKTWSEDSIIMLQSVAQTISKAMLRQKFAQVLQNSENYYRTIFENTGAATMIVEENMTISMVNEECSRLFGYAKEELIGNKWTNLISVDDVVAMNVYQRRRQIDPAGGPLKDKTRIVDRQGRYRDGAVTVDIIPGTNKSVVTVVDFTEFNRIDRALKAISAVNIAMILAENEEDLLKNVCQKIVDEAGYSMVWVGYLQTDQPQTVHPMACAGVNDGYLSKLNISLEDRQHGWGPVGTAIRTGVPVVISDLKKNDTFKPWLKDAIRHGFKSIMAIPLRGDNVTLGALNIYSQEIGRFDSDEEKLLLEMSNDLGYAIMSMRTRIHHHLTEQELENSLNKMKRILLQEVASLGTALNVKDPYTSGHQKRVVGLAAAIAGELGLTEDQIEGIEVAGNLHDIGKINVPSEILNKPGKLSDLEFAMIKTHSQHGYEIVKDIEFPWPVAEVILQTHERINGSGYPRGLAGEDILIEARIMAVADVVEAMASHRPYRPALGLEAALEEISRNRGSLYDPNVVDACVKLFQEQGFRLE